MVVGVVLGGVIVGGGVGASSIVKLNFIHPIFPFDVAVSLTDTFNI